jgi:hypothetical protein
VDLQVLKAVGLILGLQILMWIIGQVFMTFFIKGPNPNAVDKFALMKVNIILNCINFTIYAMEVPMLYLSR